MKEKKDKICSYTTLSTKIARKKKPRKGSKGTHSKGGDRFPRMKEALDTRAVRGPERKESPALGGKLKRGSVAARLKIAALGRVEKKKGAGQEVSRMETSDTHQSQARCREKKKSGYDRRERN